MENFVCYKAPEPENYIGSGITHCGTDPALKIESNMDDFTIRNFHLVDNGCNINAVELRNLENQAVYADGTLFEVKERTENLELKNFTDIRINKI